MTPHTNNDTLLFWAERLSRHHLFVPSSAMRHVVLSTCRHSRRDSQPSPPVVASKSFQKKNQTNRVSSILRWFWWLCVEFDALFMVLFAWGYHRKVHEGVKWLCLRFESCVEAFVRYSVWESKKYFIARLNIHFKLVWSRKRSRVDLDTPRNHRLTDSLFS